MYKNFIFDSGVLTFCQGGEICIELKILQIDISFAKYHTYSLS